METIGHGKKGSNHIRLLGVRPVGRSCAHREASVAKEKGRRAMLRPVALQFRLNRLNQPNPTVRVRNIVPKHATPGRTKYIRVPPSSGTATWPHISCGAPVGCLVGLNPLRKLAAHHADYANQTTTQQ
jgi:hypothetical protein